MLTKRTSLRRVCMFAEHNINCALQTETWRDFKHLGRNCSFTPACRLLRKGLFLPQTALGDSEDRSLIFLIFLRGCNGVLGPGAPCDPAQQFYKAKLFAFTVGFLMQP